MTDPGSAAPGFSWSAEETRRIGCRVVDLIADDLATLPEKPVCQPVPAEHAAALRHAPLPVHGEAADESPGFQT